MLICLSDLEGAQRGWSRTALSRCWSFSIGATVQICWTHQFYQQVAEMLICLSDARPVSRPARVEICFGAGVDRTCVSRRRQSATRVSPGAEAPPNGAPPPRQLVPRWASKWATTRSTSRLGRTSTCLWRSPGWELLVYLDTWWTSGDTGVKET